MQRKNQKNRVAFALKREAPGELPEIVAQGQGTIAQEIISVAEQAGVDVDNNSALAEALKTLELTNTMESEGLSLAADLLAFLIHLEEEHSNS